MKVAYYILHYGVEWLHWSMRSVARHVDKIFMFYTPFPSHGHGTNLQNPEGRDILNAVSMLDYDTEVEWIDCQRFHWEGEHRDFAVDYCTKQGADIILVVDADEIWEPVTLTRLLDTVQVTPTKINRIGATHFWRSVHWVCNDPAMPVRVIVPGGFDGEAHYSFGKFYHFGYAQSPAIIKYKQDIHGHKAEWRNNWYEEKFLNWKPGDIDVHPTCEKDYWVPERFYDHDDHLKILIGDHPYYTLKEDEVIE